MENNEIIDLIKEYIACSNYMCSLLKDEYDTKGETLLTAMRMKVIPRNGIFAQEYKFNFHGGGCFFEFGNGAIDVDFGPNDRCDGFDSYRLYNYLLTSKASKYESLTSVEVIKEEINRLLKEKIIAQPGFFPNPNLYYLIKE